MKNIAINLKYICNYLDKCIIFNHIFNEFASFHKYSINNLYTLLIIVKKLSSKSSCPFESIHSCTCNINMSPFNIFFNKIFLLIVDKLKVLTKNAAATLAPPHLL